MAVEPINFLDAANDRERMRFGAALQLGAEQAAWAYDEAMSDPAMAEQPLHRLRRYMLQLRGISQACGHMRIAAVCHTICMMIEDAADDLLTSLLKELKALRRFVFDAMQDGADEARRRAIA